MTALMGLDARLTMARLMVVADVLADAKAFRALVTELVAGGADVLQLRRGAVSEKVELERLAEARAITMSSQVLLVVGSTPEVASRFKADVLHLDADGDTAADARRGLHRWALVGRSVHDAAQLGAALADEATTYLSVGPVVSRAAGRAVPGLPLVAEAARLAPPSSPRSKPWFATGGVDASTLDAVLAAGARRTAVSTAVVTAKEPGAVVADLASRLSDAWDADPGMESYVFSALAPTQPLLHFDR